MQCYKMNMKNKINKQTFKLGKADHFHMKKKINIHA